MAIKKTSRPVVTAMLLILAIVWIAVCINLAVRVFLFAFWEDLFSEWRSLINEMDMHKDDEIGYQTPLMYHMVSLDEVYLIKTYRLYDETGEITEQELKERYQGMVDEANKRLSGNETKLYVGHEVPYFADTTLTWIKPINWICSFFTPERKLDEHFWFVAIYKKARSPFYM